MPFALFNYSSLSYIVLALASAVTNLSNKTLIFHDCQKDQQLNSRTFKAWKTKFLKSMTFQVFHDLYEPWVILIWCSTKYFVWLKTRVQCMLKWKISTSRNKKIIFLRYHLLNATTKWATCAYHGGPLGASDIKDGISYQFYKGRLRHIFPNKPNKPENVYQWR